MDLSYLQVDNDLLIKEYNYFTSIITTSAFKDARTNYLISLQKLFDDADQKKNGNIDRTEFERLFRSYFAVKKIPQSKENFD